MKRFVVGALILFLAPPPLSSSSVLLSGTDTAVLVVKFLSLLSELISSVLPLMKTLLMEVPSYRFWGGILSPTNAMLNYNVLSATHLLAKPMELLQFLGLISKSSSSITEL
jgi:hypothetical protein